MPCEVWLAPMRVVQVGQRTFTHKQKALFSPLSHNQTYATHLLTTQNLLMSRKKPKRCPVPPISLSHSLMCGFETFCFGDSWVRHDDGCRRWRTFARGLCCWLQIALAIIEILLANNNRGFVKKNASSWCFEQASLLSCLVCNSRLHNNI